MELNFLQALNGFGDTTSHAKQPAHTFVSKINRLAEHHGTCTGDDLDAMFAAVGHRFIGNATAGNGAVHPHMMNPHFGTFMDDLFCDLGRGGKNNPFDATGDGVQVGVTGVALDFSGVGVEGKNLIASVTQGFVNEVASIGVGTGYASDGDAFEVKEGRGRVV